MEKSPADRLGAFLSWIGWSYSELARRLQCDQSYVSNVRLGRRGAGLDFAVRLERITTEFPWPEGPIRASEWVTEDAPAKVAVKAGADG